jgi:hypothetical protein
MGPKPESSFKKLLTAISRLDSYVLELSVPGVLSGVVFFCLLGVFWLMTHPK